MKGRKMKDLTGQKFNRLTVVDYSHSNRNGPQWNCICECGTEKIVASGSLISGETKSCGCLQKEELSKRVYKHGASRTKEYRAWANMRARCRSKTHRAYSDYGGRGIKVCERWESDFKNFIEDMGLAPSPKHSLDRIDNDGDYYKENCRWTTQREQTNNMRVNVLFSHNGETLTASQWANKLNIPVATIRKRINGGHTLAENVFSKSNLHTKKPLRHELMKMKNDEI